LRRCGNVIGGSISGCGAIGFASSGNVTDEVRMEYIKNQAPPEPDDHFNVTWESAERRTNPASSSNPKPLPFRRWSIHLQYQNLVMRAYSQNDVAGTIPAGAPSVGLRIASGDRQQPPRAGPDARLCIDVEFEADWAKEKGRAIAWKAAALMAMQPLADRASDIGPELDPTPAFS
jgi:hypothetical protein